MNEDAPAVVHGRDVGSVLRPWVRIPWLGFSGGLITLLAKPSQNQCAHDRVATGRRCLANLDPPSAPLLLLLFVSIDVLVNALKAKLNRAKSSDEGAYAPDESGHKV